MKVTITETEVEPQVIECAQIEIASDAYDSERGPPWAEITRADGSTLSLSLNPAVKLTIEEN